MDWMSVPEIYLEEVLLRMVRSQRQLRVSTLRQVCKKFKEIMDTNVVTLRSPYNIPNNFLKKTDSTSLVPFFTQFKHLSNVEFQESLDLKWLVALKLSDSQNLRTLSLNQCTLEYGWEEILSQLTQLTALSLHHCRIKGSNLQSLKTLTGLETLDLSYFESAFHLSDLTDLKLLTSLNLSQSDYKGLERLRYFTKLKSLNLRWFDGVWGFGEWIDRLDLLELDISRSNPIMEKIALQMSLTFLNIQSCVRLSQESIGHIAKLKTLKVLNLASNQWLQSIDELSTLTDLESLNLSNCGRLTHNHFGVLVHFKKLQDLNIGCLQLQYLPPQIKSCSQLRSINGWQNMKLFSLGELEPLKNLVSIEMRNCRNLDWTWWLHLVHICKLRKLNFSGCSRSKNVNLNETDFQMMFSLRHLEIADAGVTDSDVELFVKKMPNLRFLNLQGNYGITQPSAKIVFEGLIDLEYCNICDTSIGMLSQFGSKLI
eukprot:TRINITY_DN4187_c0_g1_i7.p1 TRINITY_DN4187_c0_g1~~TRINITY_DN4187_c0_g1_i7.p1  ORF type:complete len:483 (+),score=25.54 TRINITY_DN4187_c0_g1_i7:149-1597(+)